MMVCTHPLCLYYQYLRKEKKIVSRLLWAMLKREWNGCEETGFPYLESRLHNQKWSWRRHGNSKFIQLGTNGSTNSSVTTVLYRFLKVFLPLTIVHMYLWVGHNSIKHMKARITGRLHRPQHVTVFNSSLLTHFNNWQSYFNFDDVYSSLQWQ